MGQCALICRVSPNSISNEVKVDISREQCYINNNNSNYNSKGKYNIIHKELFDNSKFLVSPKYEKVIYMQLLIKRYLRRKKLRVTNNKHPPIINDSNSNNKQTNLINVNINLNVNMNNSPKGNATNKIDSAMLVSSKQEKDSGNRHINSMTVNNNNENKSNLFTLGPNIKNVNNSNINNSNFNQKIETANMLVIPSIKAGLTDTLRITDDPFLLNEHTATASSNNVCTINNWTYKGDWSNGKRNGVGVLTLDDTFTFIGEFKHNTISGYGKLIKADGCIYNGQWKDAQAEGLGVYSTNKGSKFSGFWAKDKQNGFGIEHWQRCSSYEGEYVDGCKQGIGVLNFEGNGEYEGEFDNGNISGIGTFYFMDNRKYEGEWKQNRMHGFGIIRWPDGKFFEGTFCEDKKEGFGVFYSQKKIYLGIWKNSQLEGESIIIENGKIRKQFWENGKIVKQLPVDTPIFFEKYIEEVINYKEKA